MSAKVALVTGATQGLGRALVEGLAARLGPEDVVYLTGRDEQRVATAVASCAVTGGASVRGTVLDVADPDGAQQVADAVRAEHDGIDIVINNAVMRVGPDDDPAWSCTSTPRSITSALRGRCAPWHP